MVTQDVNMGQDLNAHFHHCLHTDSDEIFGGSLQL